MKIINFIVQQVILLFILVALDVSIIGILLPLMFSYQDDIIVSLGTLSVVGVLIFNVYFIYFLISRIVKFSKNN